MKRSYKEEQCNMSLTPDLEDSTFSGKIPVCKNSKAVSAGESLVLFVKEPPKRVEELVPLEPIDAKHPKKKAKKKA